MKLSRASTPSPQIFIWNRVLAPSHPENSPGAARRALADGITRQKVRGLSCLSATGHPAEAEFHRQRACCGGGERLAHSLSFSGTRSLPPRSRRQPRPPSLLPLSQLELLLPVNQRRRDFLATEDLYYESSAMEVFSAAGACAG